MRKRIYAILIAAVTLMGCKSEVPATAELQADPEPVQEEVSEDVQESHEDAEAEAARNEAWDNYWKYMDAKLREEVELDEETAALYDGFLANQVPVTYDATVDNGFYMCLSKVLTKGASYTLDEINQAAGDSMGYGEDVPCVLDGAIYLDCGLDGDIEMCVTSNCGETSLHMIIKNVDGSLKLRYSTDSWSRSFESFQYNGIETFGGSGGATSHAFGSAYLDADGNYHFLELTYEEGVGGFSILQDQAELGIDEDWRLYEKRETFAKDAPIEDSYYYFDVYDENGDAVADDPSNPENVHVKLRKYYEDQGLHCATKAEIEQMQDARRIKVGVSDEVYHYGEELKPQ